MKMRILLLLSLLLIIAIGIVFFVFLKKDLREPQTIPQTLNIATTTNPETKENKKLDCSSEIPIELIDDSTLNLDGTVTLYWSDSKTQQQVSLIVPFEPKTNFSNCSASLQSKLREINESAKELYGKEYYPLFMQ